MRVCCLFSGGKDSAYALHRMLLSGFEVPVLLTIRSKDPDSWLYHTPGLEVSHLFEGITGIPTEIIISPHEKEKEQIVLTEALKKLKKKYDLDAICSGALLSDFQRMKFSHAAMDAGMISYTPIWRKDGWRYMRELNEIGFNYILVSFSSPGFTESDLGIPVDENMLKRFFKISRKWGSHPAFEGGEAETMILGGPLFPGEMKVKGNVVREGEFNARFVIEEARVE
jgi:ABC transporter with metal-binding/Fe-S-binding domain ATP-binding protein